MGTKEWGVSMGVFGGGRKESERRLEKNIRLEHVVGSVKEMKKTSLETERK